MQKIRKKKQQESELATLVYQKPTLRSRTQTRRPDYIYDSKDTLNDVENVSQQVG